MPIMSSSKELTQEHCERKRFYSDSEYAPLRTSLFGQQAAMVDLQCSIGNRAFSTQLQLGRCELLCRLPAKVMRALRSPGQPLEASIRAAMDDRFGYDFRQVQIHTDTHAADSARELSAKAYTVGQHIVFGAHNYSPTTNAGRDLLAHELTHVVQQARNLSASDQFFESQAEHEESNFNDTQPFLRVKSDSPGVPLQLKPDRITAITVDLSRRTVTVSIDDGSTIEGSIQATNLSPGIYQARWDEEGGGLEIDPLPTTEEVINFQVSGTAAFLRRYDRLRRRMVQPVPFTVVAQAPSAVTVSEPLEVVSAWGQGLVARIQRDNPEVIIFNRPLTLDEARRFVWRNPPRSPDAIRPDPTEDDSEGRQTRYIIDIGDMDLILGMQHGLDQYYQTQIRGHIVRSAGSPEIPEWVPSMLGEVLIERTMPPGVVVLPSLEVRGEDPSRGQTIVWVGPSGGYQIFPLYTEDLDYYRGLPDISEYQANLLHQHYMDINRQMLNLVRERGLSPVQAWDSIRVRSISELRGIIEISTALAGSGMGFLGTTPSPGALHSPRVSTGESWIPRGGGGRSRAGYSPTPPPRPAGGPTPGSVTIHQRGGARGHPVGAQSTTGTRAGHPPPDATHPTAARPAHGGEPPSRGSAGGRNRAGEPTAPLTVLEPSPVEVGPMRRVQGPREFPIPEPQAGGTRPSPRAGGGTPEGRVPDIVEPPGRIERSPASETRTYRVAEHMGDTVQMEDIAVPQARYHVELNLDENGIMSGDFMLRRSDLSGTERVHRSGQLSGYAEFRRAIEHFRRNHEVRGIRSEWGGGDNLAQFNEAFQRAMSRPGVTQAEAIRQAAFQTHTGRWSRSMGWNRITVELTVLNPEVGGFDYIQLVFSQ